MTIDLTATFIPGWHDADSGDFACATATFTVNGGPAGYSSDAVMLLVDRHGVGFTVANRAIHLMWTAAEGSPTRTATATLADVISTERNPS